MNIYYYGHSSFEIKMKGKTILVDPFISANPKAQSINISDLHPDYILVTHAHYDHVWDVEAIAKQTGALIIANHEVAMYFQSKGLKCHEMNFGGSWNFEFGRLKMVFATHSSSFMDGANGGNPAGYVLKSEGKAIYIAGDTALTMDMKLIPLFFKLDLAILPIGGNFTMDVEEAVVASDFIKCNRIMGVHYDTTPEITIDHEASVEQFKAKNKELILLDTGATLTV